METTNPYTPYNPSVSGEHDLIPFSQFGETGEKLLFLHANGYPPGCYRSLFAHFNDQFQIMAMHQRPLWKESNPDDLNDWRPLSSDIRQFMDQHFSQPVHAVGHSMGAIAILRTALFEPQRFKKIVLLDPVLFPPYFIHAWNLIRALKLEYKLHPLVPAALKRRRNFNDLDRLINGYRRKDVFKYMDDHSLRTYVEGIACPTEHGYQLCYSAEWETRIYVTGVWRDMEIWRTLPNLKVPTLIIRGGETDTFFAQTGRLVVKKNPSIQVVTLEKTTHLLPLEKPGKVYETIKDFLA